MIAPSAEQIRLSELLTWFVERLELEGWRALPCRSCARDGRMGVNVLHDSIKALLDLLASQSRALEEAQRASVSRGDFQVEGSHERHAEATNEGGTQPSHANASGDAPVPSVRAQDGTVHCARDVSTDSDLPVLQDGTLAAQLTAAQGEIARLSEENQRLECEVIAETTRSVKAEAARERLLGLSTKWREEVKARAGQGCGCYGRSTQLRICADELDAALATPVRPTEGEAWKCRHCGYMENVVGGDWARAEPRRLAHEAQCPSNPDGPGHPLHGYISPRPSEDPQG